MGIERAKRIVYSVRINVQVYSPIGHVAYRTARLESVQRTYKGIGTYIGTTAHTTAKLQCVSCTDEQIDSIRAKRHTASITHRSKGPYTGKMKCVQRTLMPASVTV